MWGFELARTLMIKAFTRDLEDGTVELVAGP
jgi:acylphosphatase